MALPKLESQIVVSGGTGTNGAWQATITETGGGGASDTIEIAAVEYYLTSADGGSYGLLAEMEDQLNNVATLNATYTVTIDDDAETSTGKVTITASGGSVSAVAIAFDDTQLRDILGFTGNLSAALTYTSTNQAKHLWLPNCNRTGDHPDPVSGDTYFGRPFVDTVSSTAPGGQHVSFKFNTLHKSTIEYPNILGRKAWTRLEATTNESFQTFWEADGGNGSPAAGGLFRYYPDRATDTDRWALWAPNQNRLPIEAYDPAWQSDAALYSITFETMDHVG